MFIDKNTWQNICFIENIDLHMHLLLGAKSMNNYILDLNSASGVL